jgi:orotate phosphoribosyltransferase
VTRSVDYGPELFDWLIGAYKFRPESPFRLSSGATSDDYLDCRLAESFPAALVALGETFLSRMDSRVVAIGGLTMGADPIAMSTCMASAPRRRQVRWFTIRKEPKAHGQKKLIEGFVVRGDTVAIVDDVVTSGESTIKAIRACREFGLNIAQVTVLVDREQQNGMANIRSAAGSEVDVSAIFTKSEIKERLFELNVSERAASNMEASNE